MTAEVTRESFTDSIRRRIREKAGACPACHKPTNPGGNRSLAEAIGLSHTVLWRFLQGHDMTGRNLDKVVAWLDGST